VSTPARERSAFGQFQLGRSSTGPGVDFTKVKKLSTGDMAEWIRGGVTLHDTAKAFGVSDSTVRQRLIVAGWSSTTGQPLDTLGYEPDPEPAAPSNLFIDQPWADQALCAQTDPEAFFPEKGGSPREAKAVCAACFVAAECLDYALTTGERFGVWGGFSERERRKLQDHHSDSPRDPPPRFIEHGTAGGYRTHYRRGEQPCEPCRAAGNRAKQDRMSNTKAGRT